MNERDEFNKMSDFNLDNEVEIDNIDNDLLNNISKFKHTILVGPPGTGKTRKVNNILADMKFNNTLGTTNFIQFHPQYSYQDFIEGYTVKEGVFDYKIGVFKKFSEECKNEKVNVFVIDEINRADISSVFGELLTLLDYEKDKTVTLPGSGDKIRLTANTVIIGTMNSADKNISIMDLALRRRFSFIFVAPDYIGLSEWLHSIGMETGELTIEKYIKAIKNLNYRIITHPLLGKNMTLGQSFFVPSVNIDEQITITDLSNQFIEMIIPQIETYIGYGNSNDLAELLTPKISNKIKMGERIFQKDVIDLIECLSCSNEIS